MATTDTNPLLQRWATPYELPPFAALRPEHFAPALHEAMRQHRAEMDAIAQQAEAPSFDNTLARLDASGRLLARVEAAFHNLCASETSPALQQVQREMAGPVAAHSNALYMHAGLFARIDRLHAGRAGLGLTPEQLRLLEQVHQDFVRAGALLAPRDQLRYGALMERLAALTTQFGHEAENDVTRMKEGVAPYTRFVRGELDQVEKAQRQLEGVRRRISELNARVESI